MGVRQKFSAEAAMASPWRRRSMCVLLADQPAPAALRSVSALHAFLETNARPPLGAKVELHHREAGAIAATVSGIAHDGISLAFDGGEGAVAFALAAITSDMSRPA